MSEFETFESLGDNCEFGFVQRWLGIDPGSLLRWAVSPIDSVIRGIDSDFEGIYEFDNLTPSSDGMVLDKKMQLYFHTKLISKDLEFLDDENSRRRIHAEEYEKLKYLVQKFVSGMASGNKVYVYKANAGVSLEKVHLLAGQIQRKGGGNLLYVSTADNIDVGQVVHVEKNLYIGRVDRFAPYVQADDVSFEVWKAVLVSYLEMKA